MKRTQNYRRGGEEHSFIRVCLNSCDSIRRALARIRGAVLNEYAHLAGEHARLLRLALNEAEALAWQTEYPHLFFPALAVEKAQSAVSWHERQRALRPGGRQLALAE
jgi:hypothetical protein